MGEKDNNFKDVFKNKQLFCEFVKSFINIDLLKDITPDDIEDISERFITAFNENRDSDTIKKIKLKDNSYCVLCLLEHQSSVKYLMSFRILEYMILIWKDYIKEITNEAQKDNKNAEPSQLKDFKLPPILPIVFYEGIGNWTAEMQFENKIYLDKAFAKYIPKFEYEVVNLNKYSKEDLLELDNLLSLILLVDKIRSAKDFHMLNEIPKEYIKRVTENTSNETLKLIARIIKSLLERVNAPEQEIDNMVEQIHERRFVEMFTLLEEYDVQATRKEAREEGKQEGIQIGVKRGKQESRIEIAKKLLKTSDIYTVAEITELPIEIVKELAENN